MTETAPHVLIITRCNQHEPGEPCDCIAAGDRPSWEWEIECPATEPYGPCAMWTTCGCNAPDYDALAELEEQGCPNSPTGEHQIIDGDLMRPTKSCYVQCCDQTCDAVVDLDIAAPGRYPVHWAAMDEESIWLALVTA